MKKTILASAVLSLLSFGALADNPSFDMVEVGYTEFDFDDFDIDGFELKASKSINDNFYIAGDYTNLTESGVDLNLTTVGFGYKNDFSSTSTFFSELDYAKFDGPGFDDDGYEVTVGVRTMMSDQLELKAAVEYLDIEGDTTSLVLGAAYDLSDSLAIYTDYKYESDLSRYGVGVRFNF
jgi:hypothetical protein